MVGLFCGWAGMVVCYLFSLFIWFKVDLVLVVVDLRRPFWWICRVWVTLLCVCFCFLIVALGFRV